MHRFDPDRYYRTSDPALAIVATKQTLAQWRYLGRGPTYVRLGHRILYRGSDLNAWIDKHIVKPTADQDEAAA